MRNDVKRGEVYYVRFDRGVGHEMGYGRPVVIVSNDVANEFSPVVNVVAMTTTTKNNSTCVKLHTPNKSSWAVCNQIFTYDKSRLADYMCILSDEEMRNIDESLCRVLSLNTAESDDESEEEVEYYENDDELVELTAERDLYKRLYEKVLDMLTDVTLRGSGKVEKCEKPVEKPVVKCEPRKVVEPDGKVNVNTASEEEMMRVAGMGRLLVSGNRC
jgi:mRNA interferase MazF